MTKNTTNRVALEFSEELYHQLYQAAPVAMIAWDVTRLRDYLNTLEINRGHLRERLEKDVPLLHYCWSLVRNIDQNRKFVELMELESLATPEDGFQDFESKLYRQVVTEIILAINSKTAVDERELLLVTASGEEKYILAKSLVLAGCEKSSERVLVALMDISERRRAEEALRKSESRFKELSFKDNLTGLYNRRYLYRSLSDLLETTDSDSQNISLIFLDLDHFKTVVDTHGHLNGSRAIREVARTIDSCLENPCYGVAYAGDEFVVVLPGHDSERALAKASEIRLAMHNSLYQLEPGVEITLGASFGIATFPEDAVDVESLLSAADQALFAVKGNGKNNIQLYREIT